MLKLAHARAALAAAALAGCATVASAPVEAKVNVYIGLPGLAYWSGPGYYNRVYRDRLSCAEGRRLVDYRGFNSVTPIECVGRYYDYRARRNGIWHKVTVDARYGAIVGVR